MKFEVTSFNTFEVMPWTRFHDARMDARTDRRTDRVTPVYPTKLRLWGYNAQEHPRLALTLRCSCYFSNQSKLKIVVDK